MFITRILAIGLPLLFFLAGVQAQESSNPALPGFNEQGSDARAIAIADEVMAALGGRQNWDQTRHITWNFFGRRTHVWDKWTGDYRLEADSVLVLMNLNTGKGHAWVHGEEVTDPATLANWLKKARSIWINDSYWMFMPYKLKDSGVTLKYVGVDTSAAGQPCDVLELTFEKVGDTPENKYHVYVNQRTRLVDQWAFFSHASDPAPRFVTPWQNWRRYGNILLSDDRGKNKHTDIAVFDILPAKVYQSPEPVNVMQFKIEAQN